jgi:hypothetical protein
MVATPAHADTIDDAAAALKHASVYVATGADVDSSDTAGHLKKQLNDGDNVVIAMLPADAGDPVAAASKIEAATGHKYIVAVTIGNQTATASDVMDTDVTQDLMSRAASVSTSTTETMVTFIQNVHSWQAQHPKAKASNPASKKDDGTALYVLVGVLVLLVGAAVVIIRILRPRVRQWDDFSSAPTDVRRKLQSIRSQREKITDPQMGLLVERICRDTNEYYRRSNTKFDEDSGVTDLLRNVGEVLRSYIQVQEDIRQGQSYYYAPDNPRDLLQQHYDGIADFAEFIRQGIRRGIALRLEDFSFNNDMLRTVRNPDVS